MDEMLRRRFLREHGVLKRVLLIYDHVREKFGKEGFEVMVVKAGEIEKALGIFDLTQFTPRV